MFTSRATWILLIVCLLPLPLGAQVPHVSFEPGDVIVSLEPGPVQWRLADWTLRGVLLPTSGGTGEGMGFDRSGNLHVTRWRADSLGLTGNSVEVYSPLGVPQGADSRWFNCDPHAILFDAAGSKYVGQGGCSKSILKFTSSATTPTEYFPAEENQGVFWMDLAADGCTMFYTSYGFKV